jgi:hypothetical protein
MKKIFLVTLTVVLALLFIRCSTPATPNHDENVSRWYNSLTGEYIGSYKYVYKSTFNGHDYLMFGLGERSSVVHDPDCKKCQKN